MTPSSLTTKVYSLDSFCQQPLVGHGSDLLDGSLVFSRNPELLTLFAYEKPDHIHLQAVSFFHGLLISFALSEVSGASELQIDDFTLLSYSAQSNASCQRALVWEALQYKLLNEVAEQAIKASQSSVRLIIDPKKLKNLCGFSQFFNFSKPIWVKKEGEKGTMGEQTAETETVKGIFSVTPEALGRLNKDENHLLHRLRQLVKQ